MYFPGCLEDDDLITLLNAGGMSMKIKMMIMMTMRKMMIMIKG